MIKVLAQRFLEFFEVLCYHKYYSVNSKIQDDDQCDLITTQWPYLSMSASVSWWSMAGVGVVGTEVETYGTWQDVVPATDWLDDADETWTASLLELKIYY